MYSIYADGLLLHDPRLFNEGNGVIAPKLTVELNKAGSLEYTLPPNHMLYDNVYKMKSIITVNQNGEEIFRGRVLNDEKDFYKQKKTYCEGQLAFLLDSIQRPYNLKNKSVKDVLQYFIDCHNSRVESYKEFKVGKVTVGGTNGGTISCSDNNYTNSYNTISTQLIENIGGHLMIRKENDSYVMDLLSDDPDDGVVNTSTQIIEFGRNLLDLSEYVSAESIFTRLIPLGNPVGDTNEKLTIKTVNEGLDYLTNEEGVSLFGIIENTIDYDTDKASVLLNYGKKALKKSLESAVSLTIKAVDLSLLDVNVDKIRLGDWVRVLSIPHGLDALFQCTKIIYDMANPENSEYSFGNTRTTLTQQQAKVKKTTPYKVITLEEESEEGGTV